MQIRAGLLERLAKLALVVGVLEGKQQTDRAGLHVERTHRLNRGADRRRLEGLHDHTAGGDALVHLHSPLAIHEGRGKVSKQIEHVGTGLTADFQEIAKAGGGEQGNPPAAALNQRVGSYRGAVREPGEVREIDREARGQLPQSFQDCACGIIRGRGSLTHVHRTALAVIRVEVRKRTADVDTDCPGHCNA